MGIIDKNGLSAMEICANAGFESRSQYYSVQKGEYPYLDAYLRLVEASGNVLRESEMNVFLSSPNITRLSRDDNEDGEHYLFKKELNDKSKLYYVVHVLLFSEKADNDLVINKANSFRKMPIAEDSIAFFVFFSDKKTALEFAEFVKDHNSRCAFFDSSSFYYLR